VDYVLLGPRGLGFTSIRSLFNLITVMSFREEFEKMISAEEDKLGASAAKKKKCRESSSERFKALRSALSELADAAESLAPSGKVYSTSCETYVDFCVGGYFKGFDWKISLYGDWVQNQDDEIGPEGSGDFVIEEKKYHPHRWFTRLTRRFEDEAEVVNYLNPLVAKVVALSRHQQKNIKNW
jgi:hypothetical protein